MSSRSTQGVKLMNLDENDRLVAVAKLAERAEEDGEEAMSDSVTETDISDDSAEPVN